MPLLVVSLARTQCTMSAKPSQLVVLPTRGCTAASKPAAAIVDHAPNTNIVPFGPCISPTFPPTATATAAAFGVLTPVQCVPSTPAPWAPGSAKVAIKNQPALRQSDTCQCLWGGVITITDPGQTAVECG
jgi:hypothetical protein